jgi:hypothetical protein
MIRTIRTTVRNLRVDDVVVPKRGDAHNLRGAVTAVNAYPSIRDTFVDVTTDQTYILGLAPDLGVSVRRPYGQATTAATHAPATMTYGTGTVADRAASLTLANGGGTFDPYTLNDVTSRPFYAGQGFGYMVGIGQPGTRSLVTLPVYAYPTRADRMAVSAAILDVATVARDVPNGMVGTWVDEGLVYVEVSQWVAGRDEAIELGKAHSQRAIWDVKAGAEIPLARPATGQWREASLAPHVVR